MAEIVWETPIGPLRTVIGKRGVQRLDFAPPAENYPPAGRPVRMAGRRDNAADEAELRRVDAQIERTGRFLADYFAGNRPIARPRLDLDGTSEFDQIVLRECAKIGFGRTVTYGALARAIGRPKAARAVGGAMARNRLPLLIPCHRVVAGAAGRLGGFGGGLPLKRWLLAHEQRNRGK